MYTILLTLLLAYFASATKIERTGNIIDSLGGALVKVGDIATHHVFEHKKSTQKNGTAANMVLVNAPGQNLTSGYNECSSTFTVISNCGSGTYNKCGGGLNGIFAESWTFPGPPGTTASTYLNCYWEGLPNAGECKPLPADNSTHYCYKVIYPSPSRSLSPSFSPSISITPSTSASASQSPSASASASQSQSAPSTSPPQSPSSSASRSASITPSVSFSSTASSSTSVSPSKHAWYDECYSRATAGQNFVPMLMESVEDEELRIGSNYSVNFDEYYCDPEHDQMTYTVYGNIPPGLELNSGVLSGTLTSIGYYQLTVYAWDIEHHPPSPADHWSITVSE